MLSSKEKFEISEDFCCPISNLIMFDPVIAADGETYEREEIEKWLKQHNTSPVHNIQLANKHLMFNRALKRAIDTFLNKHPGLRLSDEIYVSKKLIQRLITAINTKDRNKIDRIVATDKRLLTRELINNQNLLALACSSTVEILNFVLTMLTKLGEQFWDLPEIKNNNEVNLFRSVAVSLGLPGAQLVAKTLEWDRKEFQEQLEMAITSGNGILAQICLQLGAKLEQKDKHGRLPLHRAINLGHYGLVNVLLQSRANPNLKDRQGNTVLHLAVINGNEKIIDLLFELAKITLTSTIQSSSFATFSSVIDNQQLLFAEVNDKYYSFMEHPIFGPETEDDCGFTALGINRDTAVQLLLDNIKNAAIRRTVALEIIEASQEGTLPKTITQNSRYQQVMNTFQRAQRVTDETMRQLRRQYNLKGTLEELLMRFQDSKETNRQKLYERFSTIKRKLNNVQQILKKYFQTENIYKEFVKSYHSSQGNKWLTVLAHHRGGIVDALATLRHINVCFWNKKSDGTLEPLHCYGNMNSATHILHTGQGTHFNFLELIALNEKEQPMQIILAPAKKPQSLKLQSFSDSIKYQLDLNLVNAQHETPLQIALNSYAKNLNYYSIIEKLLKAGTKLDIPNKDGDTPLFQAIRLKDFKLFTLLLSQKPDLETKDSKGNTALHLAAKSGFEKFVVSLLEYGANGKALNNQNETPAIMARKASHHQLAIYIERKRQELKILPFLKPLQKQLRQYEQRLKQQGDMIKNLQQGLAMQLEHRKQAVEHLNLEVQQAEPGALRTITTKLTKYPGAKKLTIKKFELSKLQTTLVGHFNSVYCIAVLPNGQLASGSKKQTIKIWDIEAGFCVKTLRHGEYDKTVNKLTGLPNGQLVSSAASSSFTRKDPGTIKIWDVEIGSCVKTLTGSRLYAVLPNGQLALGSKDQTIKIWDVKSNSCVKILVGHESDIMTLSVLPNGQLASGSKDQTIKIWDIESGFCIKTLAGHNYPVTQLEVLSNNGRLILISMDDKPWMRNPESEPTSTIKLWNIKKGTCIKTFPFPFCSSSQPCPWKNKTITLLNKQLVIYEGYESESEIKILDLKTGACVNPFDFAYSTYPTYPTLVSPLPNGRLALFGWGSKKIWRRASQKNIIEIWGSELLPLTLDISFRRIFQQKIVQIETKDDSLIVRLLANYSELSGMQSLLLDCQQFIREIVADLELFTNINANKGTLTFTSTSPKVINDIKILLEALATPLPQSQLTENLKSAKSKVPTFFNKSNGKSQDNQYRKSTTPAPEK